MPFVSTAGFFGWGNTIRHSQLALESVDNSYVLFTMRRGFVFLMLFLAVPVALGWRSRKAFANARHKMQYLPLAAALASILGIMTAMFTVWFGFAYSVLFMIMIGVANSMMDALIIGPPKGRIAPARRTVAHAPRAMAMAGGI
jgi:hypothetical protein